MKWRVFDDMRECGEEDVRRMMPLVGRQRREQALKYKHVFGQWACLKTYEMLMGLLEEEGFLYRGENGCLCRENDGGRFEEKPDFEYNEYGKPFLKGVPDFSISHCKEAVAVAVADEGSVGIDIEAVRAAGGGADRGLTERVMNEKEQAQIRAAARPEEEFTRLWTQKEAVLKCRGTGIISDLKEVLTERDGERLPKLTTWTGGGGRYVVSIAEERAEF